MKFDATAYFKSGYLPGSSLTFDLRLVTAEQFKALPKGTVLYSILGERAEVGGPLKITEGVNRLGYLGWGFKVPKRLEPSQPPTGMTFSKDSVFKKGGDLKRISTSSPRSK